MDETGRIVELRSECSVSLPCFWLRTQYFSEMTAGSLSAFNMGLAKPYGIRIFYVDKQGQVQGLARLSQGWKAFLTGLFVDPTSYIASFTVRTIWGTGSEDNYYVVVRTLDGALKEYVGHWNTSDLVERESASFLQSRSWVGNDAQYGH